MRRKRKWAQWGQRVKEGSESTLGCEGSAQSGDEQIRERWRGCSTQRDGRVQGPPGGAQGVQDQQGGRRAELSKNEGSEGRDRAGGAWGHSSNRRSGRREDWPGLRFLQNHSCALQKTSSKGEWVRIDTSMEATGIIWEMTVARTTVGAAGMERWSTLQTHSEGSL